MIAPSPKPVPGLLAPLARLTRPLFYFCPWRKKVEKRAKHLPLFLQDPGLAKTRAIVAAVRPLQLGPLRLRRPELGALPSDRGSGGPSEARLVETGAGPTPRLPRRAARRNPPFANNSRPKQPGRHTTGKHRRRRTFLLGAALWHRSARQNAPKAPAQGDLFAHLFSAGSLRRRTGRQTSNDGPRLEPRALAAATRWGFRMREFECFTRPHRAHILSGTRSCTKLA